MTGVWAVLAATAAAFVLGFAWYAVIPEQLAAGGADAAGAAGTAGATGGAGRAAEDSPPWKLLVELARCLVIAVVMAWLSARVAVDDVGGALLLGAVAWVGFPLVLLAGSVLWERVPVGRATVHAADWLVKLLAAAVIVSVWR